MNLINLILNLVLYGEAYIEAMSAWLSLFFIHA